MNKNRYFEYIDGKLIHNTPIKRKLNPILRRIQFWTYRPYVLVSNIEILDDIPHFKSYTIKRMEYVN